MLRTETSFTNRIGYRLVAVILLAGPAITFANDYPPPPGAYRSEPITLPSPTEPIGETASSQQETSNTPASRSRLLPLPVEETAPESPYASDILFGAAKPSAPPSPQEAAMPRSDFAVDFSHERSRGMPQGPEYAPPPYAPYGNYPRGYWNPQPYYPPGMSGPRTYTGPANAYPSSEPQSYVQPNYDPSPAPRMFYPHSGDGSSDTGPTFRPPGQ